MDIFAISIFVIIEEITSAHLCIPSVWDSHNTSALSYTYNLAFLCHCVIIYFISIVCISLGSLAIQAWIKSCSIWRELGLKNFLSTLRNRFSLEHSRPVNLHPLFLFWIHGSVCDPEKKVQNMGCKKSVCKKTGSLLLKKRRSSLASPLFE